MKTIKAITGMLIVAAFLAVGTFQTNAFAGNKPAAKTEHIALKVSGMSCPYCSKGLESSLCKLKGAENIKADYKTGLASLDVPASSNVTKEQLKQSVSNAGFTLKEVKFTQKSVRQTATKKQSQE